MSSARYEALGQTQQEIDNTLDIARGTKKVVKVAAKVAKAGVFGEEAQAAGHAAGKLIGTAGTVATIGEAVSDFHQAAHLEGAARDQANAHMISHAGSNAGATGGGVLAGIATGALLGSETGAVFGPVGSLAAGLVGGAAGGFMGSEAGKWAAAKFLDSTAGHNTVKAIGNLQTDIKNANATNEGARNRHLFSQMQNRYETFTGPEGLASGDPGKAANARATYQHYLDTLAKPDCAGKAIINTDDYAKLVNESNAKFDAGFSRAPAGAAPSQQHASKLRKPAHLNALDAPT